MLLYVKPINEVNREMIIFPEVIYMAGAVTSILIIYNDSRQAVCQFVACAISTVFLFISRVSAAYQSTILFNSFGRSSIVC